MILILGTFFAFQDWITPGTLVAFNGLFVGLSTAVASFTRIRRQFELVVSKTPGLRIQLEKEMDKRLVQLSS